MEHHAIRPHRPQAAVIVAALLVSCALAGPAHAQGSRPAPRADEPPRPGAPSLPPDRRSRSDSSQPLLGEVVTTLPAGSVAVPFGGGNWFFHRGVWFRSRGARYVVAAPPPGIVAPVLPPAAVSLWAGGVPYYYANGVYYAAAPGHGWRVVPAPSGAEGTQPPSQSLPPQSQPLPAPVMPSSGPPAAPSLPQPPPPLPAAPTVPPMASARPPAFPAPIVYPRGGQDTVQTDADRMECNRWAGTQLSAARDGSIFQRAFAACMEGRGYTVR